MIEPGKYTAVAREWELGLTKEGGDQIAVKFELTEGEYAGQCLVWYGFFTEKTRVRSLESLRACGWKGDDIAALTGMGDLQVQLVVEHEVQTQGKREGETFAKVRWVNRLGGGGPIKLDRPMDARAKQTFAARMRMHAAQVKPVNGGYPAPKQGELPATGGDDGNADDDIPF